MTQLQHTTPRTTSTAAKPVVTVKADGQFTCNCQSYRAALAMFGEGTCSHTTAAKLAQAK